MNNNTRRKHRLNRPAKTGAGVISEAPRRNMHMVVSHNVDEFGRRSSITRHEPINRGRFVTPKNHAYLTGSYRQPVETSSRPSVV